MKIALAIVLTLSISPIISLPVQAAGTDQCARVKHSLEREKLKKRQKERNGYKISEMRKIKDNIERLELDVEHFCR